MCATTRSRWGVAVRRHSVGLACRRRDSKASTSANERGLVDKAESRARALGKCRTRRSR